MQYYIAYSVHGTNAFITASVDVENINEFVEKTKAGRDEFVAERSRRPDFKSLQETKLHWKGLLKKDGTLHTDPIWILRKFNELKKRGFTIDTEKFKRKHFGS